MTESSTSESDSKSDEKCFCGSGLTLSTCCGVEGRTALNTENYALVTPKGITSEDTLTPEMKSAIDTVAQDPQLFPARVNLFTDKAWFIKMSPATYRDSVFLDPSRMKGTCMIETNLAWLEAVCERIQWQPTAFIFHSAFCGSTLMTQILENVFDCLSLREPELLTSMLIYNHSDADDDDKKRWFDHLQKLLSRRFEPNQKVVVKGNDFANPVMPDVVNWNSDAPILFMYTPLDEFTAACLKADNRRRWIKQRYEAVKPFLKKTFKLQEEPNINENDPGELASVYWSYNVAKYLNVATSNSNNIKSLNFNDMLADPVNTVQGAGGLFDLAQKADVDFEQAVQQSMGVYSKNSNFKYSPEQRRTDLEKQLEQFKGELEAGKKVARKLLGENYPEGRLLNPLNFD